MLIQYTLVTSRGQRPGRRWRVVPTRDRSVCLVEAKTLNIKLLKNNSSKLFLTLMRETEFIMYLEVYSST